MTPPLLHTRRPHNVSASLRHIYSALARTRPFAPSNRRTPTAPTTPAPGIWGDCGRGLGVLVYRSLGLWSALGVAYIVGLVAGPIAGPAVTSSLLVAAVTSLLTGFCYAELVTWSSQSSGHLYTVSYQLVGEFVAYLIGLLFMFFSAVTLAAVSKALSATMDYMVGWKVSDTVTSWLGVLPISQLPPDLIAAGASLCVAVILAAGLEQSGFLRGLMSVTSMVALLFFLVVGGANTEQNPAHLHHALNVGSSEVLAGAGVCMVMYSSFYEAGARVKQERRPHRALALAISITTGVTFLAFFGLGLVLTLMTGNALPPRGAPLLQALERRDVSWARLVIGSFQVVMLCLALVEAAEPLSRQLVCLGADGLLPVRLAHQYSRTSSHALAHMTGGIIAALLALLFSHVLLLEVLAMCALCINVLVVVVMMYRRHRCSYGSLCSVAATASSLTPYSYQRIAPRHSRQERTLHFLKDGMRVLPHRVRPTKKKSSPVRSPDSESGVSGVSGLSLSTRDTAPLLENCQESPASPVTNSPPDPSDPPASEASTIAKENVNSDSESSASGYETDTDVEEDVDAAVAEYQEKLRVATLDSGAPRAPTLESARRACIVLAALLVTVTVSAVVAVYGWQKGGYHPFLAVLLSTTLIVAVVLVLVLTRLPTLQPTHNNTFRVPASPWLPATALLLNVFMLVQILNHSWMVLSLYTLAGLAWYFTYSIRHSALAMREVVTQRAPVSEVINLEPLTPPVFTSTILQTPPQDIQNPPFHQNFTRLTQVDTVLITR